LQKSTDMSVQTTSTVNCLHCNRACIWLPWLQHRTRCARRHLLFFSHTMLAPVNVLCCMPAGYGSLYQLITLQPSARQHHRPCLALCCRPTDMIVFTYACSGCQHML
jgi:hypothetical protein